MNYKGKTAVITGASAGIGLAYAEEFARRGSNLVLVARRQDALRAIAERLGTEFGAKVDVIAMDLATLDAGARLEASLTKLGVEVSFLINNAGFGTNARLANEDRSRIQQEIVLNVATLVDLTRAYLPGMLDRNSGAIVNIASTASFQPVPGMAVYAATKSFVRSFTSAVWGEVHGSNVRVFAVCPGATQTEFFDIAGAKPAGSLAPVSNVVRTTFKALDARRSKPSVIDGTGNRVLAAMSSRLPEAMVIRAAASMFLPKN
ncbi:MAG: SDR family NAD(P)-dependent oxidoreductase [Micrococcales bacterium]